MESMNIVDSNSIQTASMDANITAEDFRTDLDVSSLLNSIGQGVTDVATSDDVIANGLDDSFNVLQVPDLECDLNFDSLCSTLQPSKNSFREEAPISVAEEVIVSTEESPAIPGSPENPADEIESNHSLSSSENENSDSIKRKRAKRGMAASENWTCVKNKKKSE